MPIEIVPDDGIIIDRTKPLVDRRLSDMTAKARLPVTRSTITEKGVSGGDDKVALSPAEIALVRLLVERPELPVRELADWLRVSPRMVEKRKRTITRKCRASSFAGAVGHLLTRGWSISSPCDGMARSPLSGRV